jgi:hypothetical protein
LSQLILSIRGIGISSRSSSTGIAQGKGRSGLNWFLLSLIGGPVATFALVALFEMPAT